MFLFSFNIILTPQQQHKINIDLRNLVIALFKSTDTIMTQFA